MTLPSLSLISTVEPRSALPVTSVPASLILAVGASGAPDSKFLLFDSEVEVPSFATTV